ncbi:MAG: hypothetical protein GF384_06915 [Elusimicrobia bacterium]|nr:hypothetical protein [Elusimicrobiota bacterium]
MINTFIDMIVSPIQTASRIHELRSGKHPILLFTLAVSGFIISQYIIFQKSATALQLAYQIAAMVLIGGCGFLIMIALMHLCAELMGGNGKVTLFLTWSCHSLLPLLLLIPLSLVIRFFDYAPGMLYAGALFGFAVWIITLNTVFVSRYYSLSTLKSFLILCAPFYLIMAMVIGFIFLLILLILSISSLGIVKFFSPL